MNKFFTFLIGLIFSFVAFAQSNYIDATGEVKTRQVEYFVGINDASSAFVKGAVVCFDNSKADGIHLDFCAADGAKAVGVTTHACEVGARCKLITKGFVDYLVFDYDSTATTAGGMIYATDDGKSTVPSSVTTAMHPIGVVFSVMSADTNAAKAYIDL